jgi:hypothetical protein
MNNFSKKSTFYLNTIFIILVLVYIALGWLLISNISHVFPFSGPDEIMHESMAEYIAKYLSWPNWDSKELIRNAYGVSYSTGSAIVYWVHALSYKLFGYHRVGSFILLLIYLLITTIIYKKNKIAGFFLLASLFPQALFIFSYVNSDTGTILSALVLGMSVGLFIVGKGSLKNFLIVMFFAGFAVTARQHLWVIALITLIWVICYRYKTVFAFNKKILMLSILVALVPASWWFITSYLANDGDILGAFTNAKSIAEFSKEGLPSLGRDWSAFSILTFIHSTAYSLYGNWGWTSLPLDDYEYILIFIFALLIAYFLYKNISKKIFIFLVFLVLINLFLMVIYSVFYDYQSQGRYLFPSIYVTVGIVASTLALSKVNSKNLLYLLTVFAVLNVYFSAKLTINSYLYLDKPVKILCDKKIYYKDAAMHVDKLKIVDNKLFIRGWIFNKKNGSIFNNLNLVLKKDNSYYKIELEQEERKDVARAFGSNNITDSGFSAKMIDISEMQKGKYECLISVTIDNKKMLIKLDKILKI